ncbi:hypothetical protein SAMN05428953_118113 [Mesorhizobium muleiense]|uniref:Transposase n=1 Tax=Mesorhizobium muleiense TaxID=1004279 RepID=A0A1G9DS53_9HYPH|nr:hypothetical protein SAMN05428953_118113 [Mesorhizobium muleiense]
MIFRTGDILVGQRTQLINGIRGHLSEYGLIAPQGPFHVGRLIAQSRIPHRSVPEAARSCLALLAEGVRHLQNQIAALDTEISARAKADDATRRLMSVLGIGPPDCHRHRGARAA